MVAAVLAGEVCVLPHILCCKTSKGTWLPQTTQTGDALLKVFWPNLMKISWHVCYLPLDSACYISESSGKD